VQQIDTLERLVVQLLETARVQAERLGLRRESTNLTALVRGAVEAAQARTERHHVMLEAAEEVWAEVDAPRLEQVVTNLLDNALKFSPDGGRIVVQVDTSRPERVEVVVQDQGIGVPEEHRAHLFERFYQAHGAMHQSGLGLGLYISREIVLRHGGAIRAEFPAEGGTRMVVTLPVQAPPDVAAGPAAGATGDG
jgi:signal transduction histidine kinase